MDGDSDLIIIAHLCVNDGVKVESVDKVLGVIDEDWGASCIIQI